MKSQTKITHHWPLDDYSLSVEAGMQFFIFSIEYSVRCGYLPTREGRELHRLYDRVIGKLVKMQNAPEPWLLPRR